MDIFSLWDFICIASEQMLAQKNVMFWLHGRGVRKKTVNSVKIGGHYIDFFRRSQKENIFIHTFENFVLPLTWKFILWIQIIKPLFLHWLVTSTDLYGSLLKTYDCFSENGLIQQDPGRKTE